MKKKIIFKGAATALVTPFDALGEIDFTAFGELIERQISRSIDALVVCGTTGESATLTDTERRRCISFAVEKAGGRVPIIAGTGSNNAEYAKELSCFASSEGVDGILVVTPYYNKATEKGMEKYYLSIAESATSPIIIYNVPSRTGCKVTMPVYRKLAEHENIAAVKEASGDVSLSASILAELSDSLSVYSGNDDLTLPILSLGGAGVISVLSNIMPREMHELCAAFFDGNLSAARDIQLGLYDIMRAMFYEVNPIPIKTACGEMGLCSHSMRLPMCEMNEKNKAVLLTVLKKHGLIK